MSAAERVLVASEEDLFGTGHSQLLPEHGR